MIINLIIFFVVIVGVWIVLKYSYLIYPVKPFEPGKKIFIFLDNKFNRTATISQKMVDGVVIYDKILLPIHYQGKFYAVGCFDDGKKIIYTTKKLYIILAIYAELSRKIVGCKSL